MIFVDSLMNNPRSYTVIKYKEHNVSERYEDTAEKVHKARRRQLALRKPGDLHLGPYLIVSNAKLKPNTPTKSTIGSEFHSSAICVIL